MVTTVLVAVGALVLGAGVSLVAMVRMLPGRMILVRPSRLGFDETVAALEQGLVEEGWASPGTLDLNQSMAKRGVVFKPRVKVVQLCNARYASSVLGTDRHVASLMPCAIAVYEGDDGRVYVSKMNTGLMGKLFGGNIARIMGGRAAKDEAAILGRVAAS